MNAERRLQIIAEARALVDGDVMPLWAVAAALQLGYQGESIVLHVARVLLAWHDLYAVQADRARADHVAEIHQQLQQERGK